MGPFFMRGMAAFAGGAMAAVIASRLLPPFMAQAGGQARQALGRDPFDALAQDHKAILSLLREMEASPDDATFARTQRLTRLKRRLAAHAMAEEDVVYPLLHDRAPSGDGAEAKQLYGEHAEMKMHLHALEEIAKDTPQWRERAGQLRALVEAHAREEEEVAFPTLRARLDDAAMGNLSGKVAREKALLL